MRLACLPSMPSNVYARKIFTAAINQNQFGIGVVPSYPVLEAKPQSNHDNMIKFSAVNKKPTNVIRFGAIHLGKNCFFCAKWENDKESRISYMDESDKSLVKNARDVYRFAVRDA